MSAKTTFKIPEESAISLSLLLVKNKTRMSKRYASIFLFFRIMEKSCRNLANNLLFLLYAICSENYGTSTAFFN